MSHSYNLAKALTLLSLLVPANGYPLGIGGIKLHSALNQNLDADISLVISAGDKASDIKVNLAPPDKFDEAGIPWTPFLSKIKLATIIGANGSVIIKLSSKEVIKEPILNFLLEVNWPKGSLYREFTVLLDPPIVYKKTPVFIPDNHESYQSEQLDSPHYEPVTSEALSYGPTNKNDTLWKVAEKAAKQSGVSVEQMIVALYEENPDAFYKENMNALVTGKTLKIPERKSILKYSQKQAIAEFNRQKKSWQDRLKSAAVVTPEPAKQETPEKQLTLTAPTEDNTPESVTIAPENEPITAKKQVQIDQVDDTTQTIDKEIITVTSPINDALQSKVTELEKQLAMMQQILAVKNQQLATLQSQFQEKTVSETMPAQADIIKPTSPKPAPIVTKPPIEPKREEVIPSINTYYLWWGIGTVGLSVLGWLWWRKRKLNNQSAYAVINKDEISEFIPTFSTHNEKESAKNTDEDGKHPFFSEITFGNSDTSDSYQGEIDLVSEADVYLAYGRYQQAEEIMRDVIKEQPNNDEYKLKLLKIFYLNKNTYAFETYANELAKTGKNNDAKFWSAVSEMGLEICKDSALFFSGIDNEAQQEKSILEKKLIKEPYLSSFEKIDNDKNKDSLEAADNLLDFDFISDSEGVVNEQTNNESLKNPESMAVDIKENTELELFDFTVESVSTNKVNDSGKNDTTVIKKSDKNLPSTEEESDNSLDFYRDFDNSIFYEDKIEPSLNKDNVTQQNNLTDSDEMDTKLNLANTYSDTKDLDYEIFEKDTEEQTNKK
ncbi:type IV pilus assembly protein FimV [Methylobacter psychrophilus]|uniref:type IV pilus assembly protein FimV n=1 Tax=Methylobacter psychrophilus TaxID=96941 RepID=UPI0021D4EF8C|nr:FimV/HubP family polar landmark protein [Methylobacter psychrophilus]